VVTVQVMLNRISQNYPAIAKLANVDGIYGSRTEAAVRKFQEVFGLTPDGVVGKATWYALVRLYVAVTSLAELRSRGQQFYNNSWLVSDPLQAGSSGDKVRHLQYMLSMLSEYIPQLPPVTIDGNFGSATQNAVLAFQQYVELPETGIVNATTWNEIYDLYSGIENRTLRNQETFPPAALSNSPQRQRYARSSTLTQFPGRDLRMGHQDTVRQEVVR
jgi:peptidoglycan hydrolase-like protein with peptidoglycan-binding domain